jgi:trimethylamine--corrinoid protein Co-methyltransferase
MILASPEISLLRLAVRQLVGEFYRLPGQSVNGIRMFSNANEPGIQAAMESSLMAMADLCQGIYSYEENPSCTIGVLGSLNGNLSLCLEQVLIDHEVYQYLCRFLQGIEVNQDTMAKHLIQDVPPGGSFLETTHTSEHFRKSYWYPSLLHRGTWDSWLEFDRRSPLVIAKEKVAQYLQEDLEPVLDDMHIQEVDQVVLDAEQALLGCNTGIIP